MSLDDWGTFKATVGLEEGKEMDTIDGDGSKRNARSLQLDGVSFMADKKLVRNARSHCKLERAGIVRVNQVLKVSQYMALTGLSHTTAANELRAFSCDASSGISKVGRRPAVVYVKKAKE